MSGDLVQWNLPEEDFQSNDRGSGNKKHWRHAGSKPCYPNMSDFRARLLPGVNGRPSFIKLYRHFFQLPNGKWINSVCPVHMRVPNVPCYFCEMLSKYAQQNTVDAAVLKKMEPSDIFLCNVLLRNDPARGPVVHEGHYSIGMEYQRLRKDGVNIFDPGPQGHDVDIYIAPKGSGQRNSCKTCIAMHPLAATKEEISAILSAAEDLTLLAKPLNYEAQQKLYQDRLNGALPQGQQQGGGQNQGGFQPQQQSYGAPQGYQQPQQGYQQQSYQSYQPQPGYQPPPPQGYVAPLPQQYQQPQGQPVQQPKPPGQILIQPSGGFQPPPNSGLA